MTELRVISNERVSEQTFKLRVERPAGPIKAGQCFSVGTRGLAVNREYSMYSGADDSYLDFLIREIVGGVVTPRLGACRAGDVVEVFGPFGDFCIPETEVEATSYVFIATGTGIAPFHSFVRTFDNLNFTLFHGVRLESECYEASSYPAERYLPAISRPVDGRKSVWVTNLLETAELNPEAKYYLCGNRMMITDVITLLRRRGVPGGNLYTESFF